MRGKFARHVRDALTGFPDDLATYWADKIDETASDVLGILNTGPNADGEKLCPVFGRMKVLMKTMHDANPSWRPLFVTRAGDVSRHNASDFGTPSWPWIIGD